jgi:hypothetical protein
MLVHAVSVANGRKPEMIRLRNEWVAIDPRSWKTRKDVSVSVGLGTGNKDQMLAHMQMILMAQKEAFPLGVATPPNIYNALVKLTQNAGFKDPEEFWTDPSTQPPPQPQPDPEVVKIQTKAQADAQLAQMQGQIDAQLKQVDAQTDLAKSREETMLKIREMEGNLQLQAQNDMRDHEREMQKAALEAQLKAQELEFNRWKEEQTLLMAKYKTDQDNAIKMQIAELQAQVSMAASAQAAEAKKEQAKNGQDRSAD